MSKPQVSGPRGSGGSLLTGVATGPGELRRDRQARAAVATLQVLIGALLVGAVAIGPVAVLAVVVLVQVVWVAVAGRVLGVAFSGRTVIASSALVATAATVWQVSGGWSDRLAADARSARLGVLAPVFGLVVVASLFVQLARRDGRADLTVRLAGTVLVAVLGVLPAALLAATTSGAGTAGLVVLAVAVLAAGAATGLGAGGLGTGGLGSGVPAPRARRVRRIRGDTRARTAMLGGAAVAAAGGAAAAAVAGVHETGLGGKGAAAAGAAIAAFVVLGLLTYLTALAAGTVARATPSTRSGGLVAASLAVALATPLVLVATRLVR